MTICIRILLLLAIGLTLEAATATRVCWGQAASVQLTETATVRFATRQEGIDILTAEDDFSRQLTRFDLQVRLQTNESTSIYAWRKSVADEVLDWTAEDQKNVLPALKALPSKLAPLRLPLPKEILLILTSGKEEAGAAYTRANAIVLPKGVTRRTPEQLESLLIHEIFHVLSRHSRDARRELYRIIGFELTAPIELPPQLADRKMTNPDAPGIDCTIQLTANGQRLIAAPIIYATPAQFDPQHGTSLFNYLTVRLLVLENRDGKLQVAMKGEQPVVLDPRKVDSFFEQVGRNTDYIMHPDEILADNFVHLVLKRPNLQTPRIVEQMAKVLGR